MPNTPTDHAPAFGKRLCHALQLRGKPISPVYVEREFNLRYRGNPVTPHAARKWLQGMAVPTQDKIHVLARWLDVDEEWLRWGPLNNSQPPGMPTPPPPANKPQRPDTVRSDEMSFIQDWRLLLPQNQQLVRTIMEVLLRQQREATATTSASVPPLPPL